MSNEKREVNVDSEILNIEDHDEVEETDDDEEIIPADSLEDKGEEETNEKDEEEDTSDSSPDDDSLKKEPKPVEGETPREKALRLEIQRLKTARRKESINAVTKTVTNESSLSKENKDVLAEMGYDEEEIIKMEKVIDILAEKRGYVKKSQTYQETANLTLETFIDEHPEYKPENDNDDLRWGRFQEILAADYNIAGKTPKQLKGIFEKVNRDVEEELGESKVVKSEKERNAQQQKIKSVSHSGGVKSSGKADKKEVDPSVKKLFQGFDDDDLS